MGETDTKVLIAVVIVGLISLVAVILAAAAIGRVTAPAPPPQQQQGKPPATNGPSQPPPPKKKIWTVHIGHDYGAHEYFDKTGYIRGFTPDMIKLVCNAVNIDCRTIWDKYANCWDSKAGEHASGGQGLLGEWYDGCMGWYTTVDRIHVYSFSEPYAKAPLSYFFVKKTDSSFSSDNIQGKNIGFIEGWASDEKCLARASSVEGGFLPKGSVTHHADATTLAEAINSGKVDAGFATSETMEKFTGASGNLKQLPQAVACMLAGNAMMTRKDSEFVGLWNEGFQKVRGNSEFQQLCTEARKEHGEYGSIDCLGA